MRILLCLCSIISLSACLPESNKEAAPKETAIPTSKLDALSEKVLDIHQITTPSGIKAWLVEDNKLPIISLKFSFKGAGAIQDGIDKQGLARLLSNTMDEGAGDLTSQEFQKALSDHSITLYFNSGRDNFGGQLKTLTRHKDKAFNLLKLALTQPRFDSEPVERMRQANITRIKSSMGDPDWINARVFNDVAFQGHPYALNSGGTLTTLKNITAEDLKEHKNNWLAQDNLVIGITGDITKDELEKIIEDTFSDLPKKSVTNTVEKFELQNTGKTFVYKKDIPQSIISSALPSIDNKDPDYDALRVMNFIYGGGGFGSRLMEEAREKRGLTYGIYSSLLSQDYLNSFNVSTSTKNESVSEILDITKQEMTKITTQPIEQTELQDAQSYITGSMPLSLTSTDKVASTLLSMQLNDRSINYLDGYATRINHVTVEDIQRVAKRILNPENMLTVMVGQPTNIENTTTIESLSNVE